MNEQGWNQCSTPTADHCVTATPKVRHYKWYHLLTAFQAAVWTGLSRDSLFLRHMLSAGVNQFKAVMCACTFVLLACQETSSVSQSLAFKRYFIRLYSQNNSWKLWEPTRLSQVEWSRKQRAPLTHGRRPSRGHVWPLKTVSVCSKKFKLFKRTYMYSFLKNSMQHTLIIFTPAPLRFTPTAPQITYQVQFVLPIYSWVQGHPWSLVDLPGTTTLKKSNCSFLRSHQQSMTPQGCELTNACPLQTGMLTRLILGRSFVGNHSCCDFLGVTVLSCPDIGASLWSSPTSSWLFWDGSWAWAVCDTEVPAVTQVSADLSAPWPVVLSCCF